MSTSFILFFGDINNTDSTDSIDCDIDGRAFHLSSTIDYQVKVGDLKKFVKILRIVDFINIFGDELSWEG